MDIHDTTFDCDLDRWLEALSSRPRRRVLRELVERPDEGIELTEIASESARDVHRATTSMQHRHLPKLDEVDLIEWDRDTGTVTAGPVFEEVRPLVESAVAHDDHLASPA